MKLIAPVLLTSAAYYHRLQQKAQNSFVASGTQAKLCSHAWVVVLRCVACWTRGLTILDAVQHLIAPVAVDHRAVVGKTHGKSYIVFAAVARRFSRVGGDFVDGATSDGRAN